MGGSAAAGGIAGAMIFFLLLVGAVIVAAYVLAYAAHIFLIVVDGTATGFRDVDWPDEPYFDWLWKGAYLFWLVAVWLVPLLFVGRWLMHTQPPPEALTRLVAVAAGLFWLLFPLSLLSSMSAPSRWVVLSPALLPRLAQRFGSLVSFYLITGPLQAALAACVMGLTTTGPPWVVPLAALGLAAGLLVYARLFGRLACLLRHTRDTAPRRRPARPRPAPRVRADAHNPWGAPGGIVQPRDRPPVNAPNPEARIGYDVRLDDRPPPEPPQPRRRPADPVEGKYDLAADAPSADGPRGPLPAKLFQPSEYELELARVGKQPGEPEHPWTDGVWGFPLAAANRGPVVWLSLGFAAVGTLLRLLVSTAPG